MEQDDLWDERLQALLPPARVALVDSILLAVQERIRELEHSLTPSTKTARDLSFFRPADLRRSRLGQLLLFIADDGNSGEVASVAVSEAIREIRRILFGNPDRLPPGSEQTPLGTLLNAALLRITSPEHLLTPAQVSRELQIARQVLYDRVAKGTLSPLYVSGEMRFLRSTIDAWKQQRTQAGKLVDAPPLIEAERHARSRLPPLIEYRAQGTSGVLRSLEGELRLLPDSHEWFEWLATLSSFRFVGHAGRFTAYRETKHGKPTRGWIAYRSLHGHHTKRWLGVTDHLTIDRMEQMAESLHSHLMTLASSSEDRQENPS